MLTKETEGYVITLNICREKGVGVRTKEKKKSDRQRQTERLMNRETDRKTDRQTDRQTDLQAVRQRK